MDTTLTFHAPVEINIDVSIINDRGDTGVVTIGATRGSYPTQQALRHALSGEKKYHKQAVCPTCGERTLHALWNDYEGWDHGWHYECKNSSCSAYQKWIDGEPILESQPDVILSRS